MHVAGSFNTTRAAWPHFVEQGYGRIVMTTSAGVFGLPDNLSYATAKGGVIGMTRSLATAGAAHGIKVNLIAPAAMHPHGRARRRRRRRRPDGDPMAPDLVAPMVAFLAHEDCPVSGEIYAAGAGRFARIFIASTEGYVHADGEPTSRTSPRTGPRSTTRPATGAPPTSWTGRTTSWPTWLTRATAASPRPGRADRRSAQDGEAGTPATRLASRRRRPPAHADARRTTSPSTHHAVAVRPSTHQAVAAGRALPMSERTVRP